MDQPQYGELTGQRITFSAITRRGVHYPKAVWMLIGSEVIGIIKESDTLELDAIPDAAVRHFPGFKRDYFRITFVAKSTRNILELEDMKHAVYQFLFSISAQKMRFRQERAT